MSGQQLRLSDRGGAANTLTKLRHQWFKHPEETDAAAAYVEDEASRLRDVYYTPNVFRERGTTTGGRLAQNVHTSGGVLWLDEDGGAYPEDIGPAPTAFVWSSGENRHLYWRLARPMPTAWISDMNKRIALWAGGDAGSVTNPAAVLRPPRTANFKRVPEVDVVWGRLTGVEAWEPETLEQAIPPLPEPEAPSPRRKPYTGPQGLGLDLSEFLEAGGVRVLSERPDARGRKLAIVCPWADEHSGGDISGTYCGQYVDESGSERGPTWFVCNHAHCVGRDWRAFRAVVNPPSSTGATSRRSGRNRRMRGHATITMREVKRS
jgi:hypothetical protein